MSGSTVKREGDIRCYGPYVHTRSRHRGHNPTLLLVGLSLGYGDNRDSLRGRQTYCGREYRGPDMRETLGDERLVVLYSRP